jgi:hypothetical protein
MLSKFTNILLIGAVLVFALATPSSAQTAPAEQDPSPFVSTTLTPPSVLIGETSTVAVNLNNVPSGGFASAEFICSYNPTVVEVSAITPADLFGPDPIAVVNGPQNGSFVFAVAGSLGNKATADGTVFTFSAKGLQVGQAAIGCQVRASTGDLVLGTIPSTPSSLDVAEDVPVPTQGTFAGQVIAGKPVTVTLSDGNGLVAGSVVANSDGTFSLSLPAGTYIAVASAPGFLRAQGTVSIASGSTTTIQTISLLAGDIDGNDVIDNFDALTIGINYNGTEPAVADLNSDGTINVLELEILAPNYRQIGPLVISTVGSPVATSSPQPNPTNTGIPPVTATATVAPLPTATAVPINASLQLWHAPGAHDGLNAHEHGDKPPAWADQWSMANFGHPVIFGGDEATPNENLQKHVAYKGTDHTFSVNGCSIETYFRYHAMSNPFGRSGPFHSYEMYARDCQGGISFWQGWFWVGYPEFRSQRMTKSNEQPGTILTDGSGLPAPGRDQFIISAPDHADWDNFLRSDQWYMFNPFWEVSVTILNSTAFFNYDEHLGDITNMATWDLTGSKGLTRRFEMSHYTSTGAGSPVDGVDVPLDAWYCAQLHPTEDRVEGITHRPHWDVTGAVAGPNSCPSGYVPEYKSSTFPAEGLSFRNGNAYEMTFPGEGIVTVPN